MGKGTTQYPRRGSARPQRWRAQGRRRDRWRGRRARTHRVLRAATAIGDDTLQRNAGRRVTPESFTHGSAKQRAQWFTTGLKTGSVAACDTFDG
ncbi:MAG: neutral zinc metallopeptidase [Deltaproteobacteria bacterium]|nr:neutral zinc metallopeptidase [Deltaproteobacteria bacterium]